MSESEIAQIANAFNQALSEGTGLQKLPVGMPVTAEFWAGLQQQWSQLSATERQAVRDYLDHGADKPMPDRLYSQLIGLSPADALEFKAIDSTEKMTQLLDETLIHSRTLMRMRLGVSSWSQPGTMMTRPLDYMPGTPYP